MSFARTFPIAPQQQQQQQSISTPSMELKSSQIFSSDLARLADLSSLTLESGGHKRITKKES
jgi:hypothetical protein